MLPVLLRSMFGAGFNGTTRSGKKISTEIDHSSPKPGETIENATITDDGGGLSLQYYFSAPPQIIVHRKKPQLL